MTPAEAADVSGVSVDLQRDWRRRGYLGANPRRQHTRYSVFGVAYLVCLKAFSDAGINISHAQACAAMAANYVIDFLWHDACVAIGENPHGPTLNRFVAVTSGETPFRAVKDIRELEPVLTGIVSSICDCEKAANLIRSRSPRRIVATGDRYGRSTKPAHEVTACDRRRRPEESA